MSSGVVHAVKGKKKHGGWLAGWLAVPDSDQNIHYNSDCDSDSTLASDYDIPIAIPIPLSITVPIQFSIPIPWSIGAVRASADPCVCGTHDTKPNSTYEYIRGTYIHAIRCFPK